MPELVLASGSPRRRELLSQIGVAFSVCPVDLDETPLANEAPLQYVKRLALAKARACQQLNNDDAVYLGSDTTVVCDEEILGKPADEQESIAMLQRLSARGHQVITAVALVQGERALQQTVTTEVDFRPIDLDEMQRYWQTGEPADKAGGYGIQGLGAVFVERIVGSYSAVVGLPLMETATLLGEMGIDVWQSD